jgi:hypothetical protein
MMRSMCAGGGLGESGDAEPEDQDRGQDAGSGEPAAGYHPCTHESSSGARTIARRQRTTGGVDSQGVDPRSVGQLPAHLIMLTPLPSSTCRELFTRPGRRKGRWIEFLRPTGGKKRAFSLPTFRNGGSPRRPCTDPSCSRGVRPVRLTRPAGVGSDRWWLDLASTWP